VIKLGRVARGHVAGLREDHRPWQAGVGDPAPEFAVDEISHSTSGQAKWNQRRDKVSDIEPVQLVLASPKAHGQQHAEEAAVEAHSAFPDGKYLQRIGQEIRRFVEQHLPKSPANNHPEHAVEKQVVKLFDGQKARPGFDPVTPEQNKLNEGNQIHQTVPAHGERADRESDGIELWVKKHRRRRVG